MFLWKLVKLMKKTSIFQLTDFLLQGMAYLHASEVSVHGKLRSCNCLIDGRFVLKISDFGLKTLTTPSDLIMDEIYYTSIDFFKNVYTL